MRNQKLLDTRFRLGKTPSIRVPHNLKSWERVSEALAGGSASLRDLVECCRDHKHAGGAVGFLSYCIRNGWLVEARATQIDPDATGIYVAYPTSSQLKPIYRGYKTLVNDQHTKVGIADRNFNARKSEYVRTFDGEVVFHPIVEVPSGELVKIERLVLDQVALVFPKIGRAREWFQTRDRESVIKIVLRVINERRQRVLNRNTADT